VAVGQLRLIRFDPKMRGLSTCDQDCHIRASSQNTGKDIQVVQEEERPLSFSSGVGIAHLGV